MVLPYVKNAIIENFDKVAEGIARGICAIYGISYKEPNPEPEPEPEEGERSLALEEIVSVLKKYKII